MMSDRKVAIQYNKKPVNWKHVVLHAVLLCVCPDLALVYERIRFRERRRHLVYK